jgi:hypothetical protein
MSRGVSVVLHSGSRTVTLSTTGDPVSIVTPRVRMVIHQGAVVVTGRKIIASRDAVYSADVSPPWWRALWRFITRR